MAEEGGPVQPPEVLCEALPRVAWACLFNLLKHEEVGALHLFAQARCECRVVSGSDALLTSAASRDGGLLILGLPERGEPQPAFVAALREAHPASAILCATNGPETAFRALQAGADDALVRPLDIHQLLLRGGIRARLRESSSPALMLRVGRLELLLRDRRAAVQGSALDLTRTEYRLLLLLAQNVNQVVAAEAILERAMGGYGAASNVRFHVQRLRAKLASSACDSHIETLRGEGYALRLGA